MATTNKPQILLLSLSCCGYRDRTYALLFNRLLEVAHVKRAETAADALRALAENTFKAITITDEGLAVFKTSHREVLAKVKTYVENGGLAIVGLDCPLCMRWNTFTEFFEAFSIPWTNGYYHRTIFQLSPSCTLPKGKPLCPVDGAQTQSYAYHSEYVDEDQAAVVGGRVGRGFLVYCGDVNGEDKSNQFM
ncbi:hypothetical protein BDV06DRAFT_233876 [Aspergillus oleicola]